MAPHSMLMLQTVIRPSIESASMAGPRYSTTYPWPPPVPVWAISVSTRSLAVTPVGQRAVDGHGHRLRPGLRQGLGGEDVLDLAGADAEGQRAERAVGAGVGVAADDGHAGLGQPELRADDVDDALVDVAERVQPDAELLGVAAQRLDLRAAHGVGDRLVPVERRDVVVLGGEGEVGAAYATARQAQAVEGLRRGHLVDEMEVDEEEVGLAVGTANDVLVPDLLGQGLAHECSFALGSSCLISVPNHSIGLPSTL